MTDRFRNDPPSGHGAMDVCGSDSFPRVGGLDQGDILRASHRVAEPWRNGLGSTAVVATAGGESPDWRLSIADERAGATFSTFSGVDRLLTPLTRGGFSLERPDGPLRLRDRDVLMFCGEDNIAAGSDAEGHIALNLMTRRGQWNGSMSWLDATATHPTLELAPTAPLGLLVLVIVAGVVHLTDGTSPGGWQLGPLDALIINQGMIAYIKGDAVMVRCDVEPTPLAYQETNPRTGLARQLL